VLRLRKHQSEELPDGSKQQLMTCIQLYQKAGAENVELKDAAFTLVDDALKLPEGKLITSKSKRQCLKWLEALTGDSTAPDAAPSEADTSVLSVIEAEAGLLPPRAPTVSDPSDLPPASDDASVDAVFRLAFRFDQSLFIRATHGASGTRRTGKRVFRPRECCGCE